MSVIEHIAPADTLRRDLQLYVNHMAALLEGAADLRAGRRQHGFTYRGVVLALSRQVEFCALARRRINEAPEGKRDLVALEVLDDIRREAEARERRSRVRR